MKDPLQTGTLTEQAILVIQDPIALHLHQEVIVAEAIHLGDLQVHEVLDQLVDPRVQADLQVQDHRQVDQVPVEEGATSR